MLKGASQTAIHVRPYRSSDEADVLALLWLCLGPGPAGIRPPEFFRWKHFANPFGPSFMFVAEADGRIVGLRAFVRWRLRGGGVLLRAAFAVDTATHPDYQRKGVFTELNKEAIRSMREEVDLVFNTPNERSLPGNLKMGWHAVGKVPVSIRIRRPVRVATHAATWRVPRQEGAGGAPLVAGAPARDVLQDDERPISLLLSQANGFDRRLSTRRDLSYLRWRYGEAPLLDYRAVLACDRSRLDGLAVYRVRSRGRLWETTVTELIVRPGDVSTARHLLRLVVRSTRTDLLTCHFAEGSTAARAARWSGFVLTPAGITFIVRPLRDGIEPDPRRLSSWALTLGDLEVF